MRRDDAQKRLTGDFPYKAHVAARDGPLVVDLEHLGADEPDDGLVVGKDADDVGSALHLPVQTLQRVCAGNLRPVLLGEVHVGEDVVAGGVHHRAELRLLLAERVGDGVPPGHGFGLGVLREDRLQHGDDGSALLRRGVGQGIPHPMNSAPLEGGVEHAPGGGAQALVVIGDDELHAAQAAIGERAEEVGPERLRLGRPGGDAQHLALAVLVDRDGDYRGTADDPAAVADLQVGGVKPEIRPAPFERPAEEGVHAGVDLGAEPRDLALRHAAGAQRLHQVIDGAGGDAVDVGLLHHGHQGLLGGPAGLEEAREVGALAQPRDGQFDPPGPGVPVPLAIAVPIDLAQRAAGALGRAGRHLGLRLHDPIGGEGQHVAHQVSIGALLHQFEKSHPFVGHRWSPVRSQVAQPEPTEDRR